MAWVTPPTFTVGQDLTSTAMNQISGDLSALGAAAFPIGIGTAAVGTAPTDLTKLRWQAGQIQVTTDGSGNFVFGFAVTFPAGVISTFLQPNFGGGPQPWLVQPTNITTSAITGHVMNSTTGAAVTSTAVQILWYAIGF